MKCPISSANPHTFDHGLMECDSECAWIVKKYSPEGKAECQCGCVLEINERFKGWHQNSMIIEEQRPKAMRKHDPKTEPVFSDFTGVQTFRGWYASCKWCGKKVFGFSQEKAIENLEKEPCK